MSSSTNTTAGMCGVDEFTFLAARWAGSSVRSLAFHGKCTGSGSTCRISYRGGISSRIRRHFLIGRLTSRQVPAVVFVFFVHFIVCIPVPSSSPVPLLLRLHYFFFRVLLLTCYCLVSSASIPQHCLVVSSTLAIFLFFFYFLVLVFTAQGRFLLAFAQVPSNVSLAHNLKCRKYCSQSLLRVLFLSVVLVSVWEARRGCGRRSCLILV
jgi:hypothetical protein